jgi:hypothetical protein
MTRGLQLARLLTSTAVPTLLGGFRAFLGRLDSGRVEQFGGVVLAPTGTKSRSGPMSALNADGVGLLMSAHFASAMAREAWTGWRPC